MKYVLVSLSVVISGNVFRKGVELDDSQLPKSDLEASYAAGFIKPKGSKAETVEQVIAEYKKSADKKAAEEAATESAKAEAIAKEQEAKNKAEADKKAAEEAATESAKADKK